MIWLIKILAGICAVLYPLLVLWVLTSFRAHLQEICLYVLPILLLVCAVEWFRTRQAGKLLNPLVAMGLLIAVAMTDAPDFFKLYPILVSSVLLAQFGSTLITPPSMIERFARLASRGEPLPDSAIPYCRKVTWVWVGFFCFNITVSALTALIGNWEVWTLYNGCISYILIGLLLSGEWLVRRYVQRKQSNQH